jgi:hypothetical protein
MKRIGRLQAQRNLLWPSIQNINKQLFCAKHDHCVLRCSLIVLGRMKRPFQWQLDQIVTESMPDYKRTPMVIESWDGNYRIAADYFR